MYLTSREVFEDTARYWTQVYAGGKGGKGGVAPSGATGETVEDDGRKQAQLAGIEWRDVTTCISFREHEGAEKLTSPFDRFADMGFEPKRIVEVLQVSSALLTRQHLHCYGLRLQGPPTDPSTLTQLLNYRGANRERVGHEAVLEKLFA